MMTEGSLYDRLRRLKHGPEPPPPSALPDLENLEQSLLGATADGLTLKQRLERLVAVAARGRARARVPLEEAVKGERRQNEMGEYFVVEEDLHIESRHGDVPLSRFRAVAPGSVRILTGEPALEGFDLPGAVFLDTETTGLAGGTGTAAFLIGIGFLEDDRFRVRQYFMRDYHEEAAVLRALCADLARFSHLVTFNGKMFDLPLLESRFRLNRERFPLAESPHLDLLHPARRLWKARLESCRLQSLERELLGLWRVEDVPGEEIPQIYFDYIRSRDARRLPKVLEHNRLDIVSLAALALLACQWVEGALAEDPRDCYSLGRVLERAALYERSEAEYRRALAVGAGRVRVLSLLRLASRAKRAGDHATAVRLWEEAAEAGDWFAVRELAVHHEHRSRDLGAALRAVEAGLVLLAGGEGPRARRFTVDLRRRRERLALKLAREDVEGVSAAEAH